MSTQPLLKIQSIEQGEVGFESDTLIVDTELINPKREASEGSETNGFADSEGQLFEISKPSPVVYLEWPDLSGLDTFIARQKWEGFVEEIKDTSFTARLADLTKKGPDEFAEFSLEELTPADRELVAPGAVFYWSIGYNDSISGTRTRQSVIRFRRLPAWGEDELRAAKGKAEQMRKILEW